MTEWLLIERILARSVSKDWEHAKKEWRCSFVQLSEEPQACLCSHYPIKELCHMTNRNTGVTEIVGNCCVNKFFDERMGKVFQAIKDKRINKAVIDLANDMGIFNSPKQYEFMLSQWRKRSRSLKDEKTWRFNEELVLTKIMEKQ